MLQNFWWTCNLIRNDIINVVSSSGATKAHELNLNWRRPQRENILSSTGGPAVKIE